MIAICYFICCLFYLLGAVQAGVAYFGFSCWVILRGQKRYLAIHDYRSSKGGSPCTRVCFLWEVWRLRIHWNQWSIHCLLVVPKRGKEINFCSRENSVPIKNALYNKPLNFVKNGTDTHIILNKETTGVKTSHFEFEIWRCVIFSHPRYSI
jgi:hypothetical protein